MIMINDLLNISIYSSRFPFRSGKMGKHRECDGELTTQEKDSGGPANQYQRIQMERETGYCCSIQFHSITNYQS